MHFIVMVEPEAIVGAIKQTKREPIAGSPDTIGENA
jgi:hypothetical protein